MQNTRCVYISGKVCGWDHGLIFVTCRQDHQNVGLSNFLKDVPTACFCGGVKPFNLFGTEGGLLTLLLLQLQIDFHVTSVRASLLSYSSE